MGNGNMGDYSQQFKKENKLYIEIKGKSVIYSKSIGSPIVRSVTGGSSQNFRYADDNVMSTALCFFHKNFLYIRLAKHVFNFCEPCN